MTLRTLTIDEARWINLVAQQLEPPSGRRRDSTRAELLDIVRRLGCVQLDSISVVARSHQTVLWSRAGAYDPADLAALQSPDLELTEYWAHAAALVPVETLPLYRRCMDWYRHGTKSFAVWGRQNADLVASVRARVERDGPLQSKAFERPEGPRPEPWAWWGGKPEKQALDYLWTIGDLVVTGRVGFQRIYDLTERVFPDLMAQPPLPSEEERRAFVRMAVRALGIVTPAWVSDYFRASARPHVPPREAALELKAMAADGLLEPVDAPWSTAPAWIDVERLPDLDDLRERRRAPRHTTLLSPFDSLVWHRARASTLFGFEYLLESYTPPAKRQYGYYTLPILHRGRLAGRVDPQLDRKERRLNLRAIHLEPGIPERSSLARDVARAAVRYAAFAGATDVKVIRRETSFERAIATELGC